MMVKRLFFLSSGMLIIAALYLTMIAYLAEREDMSAGGLYARLMIPDEIRELELPGLCEVQSYSRSFLSCGGGECGWVYRIEFTTGDTNAELQRVLDVLTLPAKLHVFVTFGTVEEKSGEACSQARISFHSDEAKMP